MRHGHVVQTETWLTLSDGKILNPVHTYPDMLLDNMQFLGVCNFRILALCVDGPLAKSYMAAKDVVLTKKVWERIKKSAI